MEERHSMTPTPLTREQQLERQLAEAKSVLKLAQKWLANCMPAVEIDGPKPLPLIAAFLTTPAPDALDSLNTDLRENRDKYMEAAEANARRLTAPDTGVVERLQRLWQSQSAWSQATFGSDAERGPVGAIKHLRRECDEVLDDPTDRVEYADCFLLILDAARRAGMSLSDLIGEAEAKHAINESREWSRPVEDEPVHHVAALTPAPDAADQSEAR